MAEAVDEAVRQHDERRGRELATKADLAELKADLIKWVAGLVIGAGLAQALAVIGGILAVARLLPHA